MNYIKQNLDRQKREYRKYFLDYTQFIGEKIESLTENEAVNFLQTELENLKFEYEELLAEKERFNCAGCGICCRFAVSEFSPDELEQKALGGDNFAKQFISVFVPYQASDDAAEVFPEYFELLKESDGYYIYHCPKITKDNRCADYNNRPQICRDFPDNPVAVLPTCCGYKRWKNQIQSSALKNLSNTKIIEFYLSTVKQ